ncbi:MAG: hypothetical protein JSW34_03590, partial [Candidatus Zixiibacteriota bacterium]
MWVRIIKRVGPHPLVVFIVLIISYLAVTSVVAAESDSILARLLDFSAGLEVRPAEGKLVTSGLNLSRTDTLVVADSGYVVLVLNDGRIERFDGPRLIITANLASSGDRDSGLGRLIQAFVSLFFSDEKDKDDAHLVVRDPTLKRTVPLRVP